MQGITTHIRKRIRERVQQLTQLSVTRGMTDARLATIRLHLVDPVGKTMCHIIVTDDKDSKFWFTLQCGFPNRIIFLTMIMRLDEEWTFYHRDDVVLMEQFITALDEAIAAKRQKRSA